MTLPKVLQWLKELEQSGCRENTTPLSNKGLENAVSVSINALHSEALQTALSEEGAPFSRMTFVAAGTVVTAPLEWVALQLARGGEAILKRPGDQLEIWEQWALLAKDLPLQVTTNKSCIHDAPLVVAMGSDRTIQDIASSLSPSTRFLGFGNKFSVAWIEETPQAQRTTDYSSGWEGLAADLALHDGRGCMSPCIIFTPLPLEIALNALEQAMIHAQEQWPRGQVYGYEASMIRSRKALTRVVGSHRRGEGFSIHALTHEHVTPMSLPRTPTIVSVPNVECAVNTVSEWGHQLSTVGTDNSDHLAQWKTIGASRVCPLGEMQHPPLLRHHDGVDWIRATLH
jgi:hypothetical protein